ncbi:phosphodiester glycosidase family protein [Sphingobacterium sp. SGG-5]|uniref:phosphodiester glycosidase family protein n=1 Tax=Sphingobacterium sp. SGG-5 TaxID=2710881 RepID=UPI0013ECBDE6|nr:phosphodiester glycosidase family protein [Sphingobacterium sp. SGG-5]NGM62617.1 phosphodiester glycosidase family protein [Sphingobacterium sp. SGG-5]
MKQIRKKVLFSVCLFLLMGCKAENTPEDKSEWAFAKYLTLSKAHDAESNTTYYLTRIKHKDDRGNVIKLRTQFANRPEGETARTFAIRNKTAVTINGSQGLDDLPDNQRQPAGVQIIDGEIIQDLNTTAYTLGIKDNNELLAYAPGTEAQDILDDGTNTALTAFYPLIENYEWVSDEVLAIRGNSAVKHPRQVIAQFDNLDLLIFSCGGRGFDGDGMTAKEMMKILKELGVKFAFNLDGGGSTSTVIKDQLITKKIDNNGTRERLRPNFLYVMEDN